MPWKAKLAKPLGWTPKPKQPNLSASKRGYTAKYRRDREDFLKANPLCMICQKAWTKELDHIDGDSTNNDPSNWQGLCVPCHKRKTTMNRRKYGHG